MMARSNWRRLELASAVKDWIGVVRVVMELIGRLVSSWYVDSCLLRRRYRTPSN